MCAHIDMKTVLLINRTFNYSQNILVYSHIYCNY
uniref:Uncharacterized protein n=1 Tax=Anguilla anguilla TaxID=7936 RepID=A0A0E9T575_ANGAN